MHIAPNSRRRSREVHAGSLAIGGHNPIRIQSMITCDTMDTQACIAQTTELAEAGCEIVRITAPTVKDAANLQQIVGGLRRNGCRVPIVADIHFKPEAAMEAAKWVEKVRINPGNFADSKKFNIREYSDAEYTEELERIRERFTPLVQFCKQHGRSMRIGTNHGSLSDRIMNRYGDTPLGMVESALEFARVARALDYHEIVFSMKSSNPKVMIEAYRLLAARLDDLEGELTGRHPKGGIPESQDEDFHPDDEPLRPDSWLYPIHLGVTEAGDGEDGRIKSAIGIGSLLMDGIGDTIRVSLTEDSVREIPVAQALINLVERFACLAIDAAQHWCEERVHFDSFSFARRETERIELGGTTLGGEEPVRVAVRPEAYAQLAPILDRIGDLRPELVLGEGVDVVAVDPRNEASLEALKTGPARLVTVVDGLDIPIIPVFRLLAARIDARHSILLKDTLLPATDSAANFERTLLRAATHIGSLLCDGIGDAVVVQGEFVAGPSLRLAWNILQAAGCRNFKTDYVACPSCGRTLFDLQETTGRIKEATAHLKGVKIAIMGCIVNGPGEMADADFGYVGGAPGKINLYVGKKPVKFNIPQEEAVSQLKDLIREHGKWVEPVAV